MKTTGENQENVREIVRERYSAIALGKGAPAGAGAQGCGSPASSCCGGAPFDPSALAERIGYEKADLESLPQGSNLGLSCGNPTALASLEEGEVVLDLGSGGGLDVFLAGPRVGPGGRVIGVDMTPAMLDKARRNAEAYRRSTGLSNVEFRLGEIEHLPVPDGSVDVVISNCVINLSPDKPQVWREIARVLKPGGRVAVSDVALLKPLPEAVARDPEALVGCIAGAALVEEVRDMIAGAGLIGVELERKGEFTKELGGLGGPGVSDSVTSLNIKARKRLREESVQG